MAERPIAEGVIRFTPDARSLANVEKSVKKAIGRIEGISARGGLLAKNYVQPLGQITGAADEFTKSLEASNARVIAFGASAGIIYNVQRALTASVGAAINLEKQLADINVILNETNVGLRRFGDELFTIAKSTGQTFNAVSEAALEFARQGLAVEETLKRTRDAMILVRLSGLDVKSSVESITATLNSFNQTVINSTELVNKLANVDAAFAVSSADLAEAIRRVGSSAQDSNVNIDQLIALVTTAQQVTARGGSVIGNSLKTIFTRLQRPQVIADLEAFGIAVKDQSGAMLDTMTVLQNFANTYDKLAPSQKAVTAELVGGVFQINVLKAALGDLGKQYSIYDRALNVSLTSTDQAIARNELLNKTLSTLVNETLVNVQKVGAAFANLTVTPALTNILEAVNDSVEKLEEKAAQGDLGVTFGKGILQGLSNVLSGPALVAIAGILGKLTFSFFKFSSDAVKTFAGLNATANQQKEVQMLIQNLLIKNPSLISAATSSAEGLRLVEQEILKIVQARNVSLNQSAEITKTIAANLSAADLRAINASVSGGGATSSEGFIPVAASGFVPNYNRKNEQAEIMGALQGGYMPGKIDTMQIQGIGRVTYNQAEEVKQFPGMDQPAIIPPRESEAGKNYERRFKAAHGFNPYHQGMIPNFEQERVERRAGNFRTGLISTNADKKDKFSAIINVTRLGKTVEEFGQDADAVIKQQILPKVDTPVDQRMKNVDDWAKSLGNSAGTRVDKSSIERIKTHLRNNPKPDFRYLNNQIKGVLGEVAARKAVKGKLQQGNSFFDIMSREGQPTEVRTRQKAQLSDILKKGANTYLTNILPKTLKDGKVDNIALGNRLGKIGLVVTKNTDLQNASGGFIPNFEYSGLRDEDLGNAFVNVNPNNKAKTIDTNLTEKEITKRVGGKTLIRGPEGETLIFGGDLEGRAGTITVGGLNARKIKKSNAKFAPLLNQMPNLFDGLAYQIMGAIGAKFDPGSASGAVAGVKFEDEFAEKYGLPTAGAKKGSDFVIAEELARELGTSKHLQLKLSVFERSKRDIKKVVDVASAFSNYLVHMLTSNIKTQGLSKLVGPERYRQAMAVMNQNPAMKSDWTKYFGQKGIMADGFVPNFTGDALKAAIGREMAAGYSRSQVKVGYDSRLAASGGIGVYNTSEGSLGRAINMHRASGKSMKDLQTQGASGGYVPNFQADFGDIVGGGLSFALIAPAIQSMVQSSKEFRNERKEEANAIKELTEAVAKAKESVGEHAEELESAQQKASRASELEQKASEKVQAMRDRIAKGPQETDTGLLSTTNFEKRAIKELQAEGLLGPKGPRKVSTKGKGRKDADFDQNLVSQRVIDLTMRKSFAEDENRQLELDKATIGAEEAKLAALEQQVQKHKENVELLTKKNEATKGVTEAENKLKKEQEAQAANRKNAGNRLVSRFGTGVAFAAPMLAGQASTLFQAAGGSAAGAAGINALGTGLGTAGALGTTAAEIGTNVLESDAFKGMQDGGLKSVIGGAARFAGPIAAVGGVALAIDNMGKAIAKAKIKEQADKLGKELENVGQQFNRLQQSGQQFMESFDKLKNALDDPLSANAGDIQKIQTNLAKALSDAPAEFRNKIKAAAGDADKIREAFGEISIELQRQQAALKGAQDILNLQADLGAGGGLLQLIGRDDRTIFEDNAEGRKALTAARGIVGSTLDRGGLAEALQQGRNIDLAGADLREFFGNDFANALSGLSFDDQKEIRKIIQELFTDIKESAEDAKKVAEDLKKRQEAERAYQKTLKNLNLQLESLTASLNKASERTVSSIQNLIQMQNNLEDFEIDFAQTRATESRKLLEPFLTRQEGVRSATEQRQFEIRANTIKEIRKAVQDGAFNALKITTSEFQAIAGKVEGAFKNLGQGQSRELLTQLQRDRRALSALAPIMENAFKTFAQNPKKLDVLNGISSQIFTTLRANGYTVERATALSAILNESIKANGDATGQKLGQLIQQQALQLEISKEQAYWQQEEAKLSERIASFGGASDFNRAGQTNLSSNFDKLTTNLSSAIGAQISGGIVELGRANAQLLDTLLNNLNIDSLRGNLEGLAPLLGPAIVGRAADLTSQLAFAERLANVQGLDVDTSGVDTTQIAIEQLASQLKLKDLPDHVAEIARNQAILNSILVDQASDIASKNRTAFDQALKLNGLNNLDANTRNAAIAGRNNVNVGESVKQTNVRGFNQMITALGTDLPNSIKLAMSPFQSKFREIEGVLRNIETVQAGRGLGRELSDTRSSIAGIDTSEVNRILQRGGTGIATQLAPDRNRTRQRFGNRSAEDIIKAMFSNAAQVAMSSGFSVPERKNTEKQLGRSAVDNLAQLRALGLSENELNQVRDATSLLSARTRAKEGGGVASLRTRNLRETAQRDLIENVINAPLRDARAQQRELAQLRQQEAEQTRNSKQFARQGGIVFDEGSAQFRNPANFAEKALGETFDSGTAQTLLDRTRNRDDSSIKKIVQNVAKETGEFGGSSIKLLVSAIQSINSATKAQNAKLAPLTATSATTIDAVATDESEALPEAPTFEPVLFDVERKRAIAALRNSRDSERIQREIESINNEVLNKDRELADLQQSRSEVGDDTISAQEHTLRGQIDGLLVHKQSLNTILNLNKQEEEIEKQREKILEAGRRQVGTLKTIADGAEQLDRLLQAFRATQEKIVGKKVFDSAQRLLELSVTPGDAAGIRSQGRSALESGLQGLTRGDAESSLALRRESEFIAGRQQAITAAGTETLQGLLSSSQSTNEPSTRLLDLIDSGDVAGAAIQALNEGIIDDAGFDKIIEDMDKLRLSSVEAGKRLKSFNLTFTAREFENFLDKANAGLQSSGEIANKIDATTKSLIENGTDLNITANQLKDLQLAKTKTDAEEFANALNLVRNGLISASVATDQNRKRVDEMIQTAAQNGGQLQFNEANETLAADVNDARNALIQEQKNKREALIEAEEKGLITTDQLRERINQLNQEMIETGAYGFTNFMDSIRNEFTYTQQDFVKDMDQMGREFGRDFKSGTADAFSEAIKGTKTLKAAFSDLFANLADKMLDRSLDMATNTAFSFLGFNKGGYVKGYSSGGIVQGGSGIKDDVPAYLSRGEYVIRKKTVNEYGKDFFDSLNSAKVVAANSGGMIDNTKLTKESADRIFGGSARNMAAIQAERQKRQSALQRAGIEAFGYKESTGANKRDIFGRDTGQKVLANRVGFRLDFGKPLNERRIQDIQNAVNAYPEIGPFIDPDIFKRSTVEIGGGATKLKLKNSFIYNETKRPDQGRFVADPRLSTLALNDENNPQNKYKFEKADTFFNYQKDRLDYYAEKQKELQEFQEQKANKRRSFLFGAGALLFSGGLKGFAKGGQNKEDDIPALLTGGEYVVRKGIVDKYGLNFFENLNRGKISAFNKGGYVAPITGARTTTELQGGESDSGDVQMGSTTNNISISVNVENNGAVTTEANQDGARNTNGASQEETKELAERIRGAVVGVIAEQKRPGGMLYGTQGSV